MWPWGHLALGYLLYAGVLFARDRSRPRGAGVVALAVGTQFPDLVDKPVAYWTVALPAGRSLVHSLVVAVPLAVAVRYLTREASAPARRAGAAFVLGHLSHLIGDAIVPFLAGRFDELSFLLWPALALPDYEAAGFPHHWHQLTESLAGNSSVASLAVATDPFVAQLWLSVIAAGLWLAQGAPPLARLRAW